MALATSHTWNPGDILKAVDLNGVITNILTNPIALISPSTGAINFNLQAHTGLIPGAITATSASAGQALMSTGGAAVSFQSVLSTATVPLAGSTGQVLAITSSSTGPSFQVLPIDGGLSTTIPTGGMIYFVGTSAAFLRGLTIGTSGQVLMVATSGLPTWQNLTTGGSAGGGSGALSTSNDVTLSEDFLVVYSSYGTLAGVNAVNQVVTTVNISSSVAGGAIGTNGFGVFTPGLVSAASQFMPNVSLSSASGGAGALGMFSTVGAGVGGKLAAPFSSNFASTTHFSYFVRFIEFSSAVCNMVTGFTTNPDVPSTSMTGIYLQYNATGNVSLVGITSSGGTATLSAGVTASSWHTYLLTVSSSAVALTVDGASVGIITSSGIPNIPLTWSPMLGVSGANQTSGGILVDFYQIATTAAIRV